MNACNRALLAGGAQQTTMATSSSSPAVDAAAAEPDPFMRLVDEYIGGYPLVSSSISHNNLRLVAAKLLLYQRMKRKSSATSVEQWPGSGAARLAAIMLVLFVQECLAGNQRTVLGVAVSEFYEILSVEVVRKAGVTRDALMWELIEVDQEGTAIQFASSNEITKLWQNEEPYEVKLKAVKESSDDAAEWSDNTLLPETAREAKLPQIVTRKLTQRSRRFPIVLCASVSTWLVAWFLSSQIVIAKDLVVTLIFGVSCSLGTTIAAALFPNDLASVNRRITLWPCCITAVSVCAVVGNEMQQNLEKMSADNLNPACRAVTVAMSVIFMCAWTSGAVLSALESYSWRNVRLVFLADGLAFVLGATSLRVLGPPDSYPPSDSRFGVSLLRGLLTCVHRIFPTRAPAHHASPFFIMSPESKQPLLASAGSSPILAGVRWPTCGRRPTDSASPSLRSGTAGTTSSSTSTTCSSRRTSRSARRGRSGAATPTPRASRTGRRTCGARARSWPARMRARSSCRPPPTATARCSRCRPAPRACEGRTSARSALSRSCTRGARVVGRSTCRSGRPRRHQSDRQQVKGVGCVHGVAFHVLLLFSCELLRN